MSLPIGSLFLPAISVGAAKNIDELLTGEALAA